jgi:AraC family transcriptional regulator
MNQVQPMLPGPVHPGRLVGSPQGTKSGLFRGGLAAWQVHRVREYIDAHLTDPLLLEVLARVIKLSVSHFARAFRQTVGASPHVFVTLRRLEYAQGLMLATDRCLGDIALASGFADQAHFGRVFRRFCGESPGMWRRARAAPPWPSCPECVTMPAIAARAEQSGE